MTARFQLSKSMFGERERSLLRMDGVEATAFRYESGVEALRITNARGEIVLLPFQGQQIWSAAFDGRELGMRSMFPAPVATDRYLETFGSFVNHCGILAVAGPGPEDDHPLHGELPNAPFQEAWIDCDPEGGSLTVAGAYRHTVAFTANYVAEVRTTIETRSALLDLSVEVRNRKRSPMEVMYLAHANFRPVDGGELVYTAPYDAEHVRVRRSIPAHITPGVENLAFIEALASDPAGHHLFEPGLPFDPEVVFTVRMRPDEAGWAHAMQVHPDGRADYIRYRPDQAPIATRWICRTPDQEGLSIVCPATAGVEGRSVEKARGNYAAVAGGGSWRIDMVLGALEAEEAAELRARIDGLMGR